MGRSVAVVNNNVCDTRADDVLNLYCQNFHYSVLKKTKDTPLVVIANTVLGNPLLEMGEDRLLTFVPKDT